MKDLLIRLGLFLLFPFEKASHATQWLTGYNCFMQARFITYGQQFCVVAMLLETVITSTSPPMCVFMGLVYAFMFCMFGQVMRSRLSQIEKKQSTEIRNVRAIDPYCIMERSLWLFLAPVGISPTHVLFFTLLAISYHLSACTPLPPRPGKIKEWWNRMRSFSFGAEPVPEGAGV